MVIIIFNILNVAKDNEWENGLLITKHCDNLITVNSANEFVNFLVKFFNKKSNAREELFCYFCNNENIPTELAYIIKLVQY